MQVERLSYKICRCSKLCIKSGKVKLKNVYCAKTVISVTLYRSAKKKKQDSEDSNPTQVPPLLMHVQK